MFKREQITSFSEIRLKVSGMRLTEVYEILCCGDDAEVSQYWLSYKNHEDNYNLQKHVTVPAADVIDVLNQCGIPVVFCQRYLRICPGTSMPWASLR